MEEGGETVTITPCSWEPRGAAQGRLEPERLAGGQVGSSGGWESGRKWWQVGVHGELRAVGSGSGWGNAVGGSFLAKFTELSHLSPSHLFSCLIKEFGLVPLLSIPALMIH